MEELQARHRKEAKDLQSKITSKKKQATKKTRKGVNDECDRLEAELKDRQATELAVLSNDSHPAEDSISTYSHDTLDTDLANGASTLSLGGSSIASSSARTADSASLSEQQSGGARRPNRVRARMERRRAEQEALFASASAEAANMPDLKAAERERMIDGFRTRGLMEKEIRADGHCLYSAFADQMDANGLVLEGSRKSPTLFRNISNGILGGPSEAEAKELQERYRVVRREAGEYMLAHKDDFAPFLEEDLDTYVHKVKDTAEWGGQMELMALARRYGVQINVLQGEGRVEEIVPEDLPKDEAKILWLAYYRHGFGLGEHYNSLRKIGPP